jgi:hypothetical protein
VRFYIYDAISTVSETDSCGFDERLFSNSNQKVFRRDAFGNVSVGPTGNAHFKNKSENYISNNKEKIRFG